MSSTATDDAILLKRQRVTGALWLLGWVVVSVWSAYALAQAWPYVGLPPQIALLLAVPGVLFRSFDLAFIQIKGRRISGAQRLLARASTLVAGVALAAAAWGSLDDVSMSRFERAFAPLTGEMHARMPKPCPPAASYAIPAELTAYLEESGAPRAPAELKHDARRFVLTLHGGSIDIDGSTLFYDSATRKWRKAHNDMLEKSGELRALVDGLESCRVALR